MFSVTNQIFLRLMLVFTVIFVAVSSFDNATLFVTMCLTFLVFMVCYLAGMRDGHFGKSNLIIEFSKATSASLIMGWLVFLGAVCAIAAEACGLGFLVMLGFELAGNPISNSLFCYYICGLIIAYFFILGDKVKGKEKDRKVLE